MRVIAGTHRSRKLSALPGEATRPTADHVKEAAFSILQNDVPGAAVLDLCAGSGQLAIEALSRGALRAVLVEQAADAVRVIRENLAACAFEQPVRVVQGEALAFLQSCAEKFDVILLDPPYDAVALTDSLLLAAPRCLAEGGVVLVEVRSNRPLPEQLGKLALFRSYRYGKIKLATYREENA